MKKMLMSHHGVFGAAVALGMGASSVSASCGTPQWLPGDELPGVGFGTIYSTATWDPDGSGGPLSARLIAGGGFFTAGGKHASKIAAWDGQQWHALAGGVNGSLNAADAVNAMTVYNGDLIVCGNFTYVNGATLSHNIARCHYDSATQTYTWQALGSGTTGGITGATVYNGDLVVCGNFASAGGQTVHGVARWDGSAWHPMGDGFNIEDADGIPFDLAVYNGSLYCCGSMTNSGNVEVSGIARWNGTGWEGVGGGTVDRGGHPDARALAVYDNQIIMSGSLSSAGPVVVNNIARWDGSQWRPVGPNLALGSIAGFVPDIAVVGSDLIAVGAFFTAGGQAVHRVARFNGTSWSAMGAPSMYPFNVISFNGQAYVSGSVYSPTADGMPAGGVIRWNGSAWQTLAPDGLSIEPTHAAGKFQGALVVSADQQREVNSADEPQLRHRVVRWENGVVTQFGGLFQQDGLLSSAGPVRVFLEHNGFLYAGGGFTSNSAHPGTSFGGIARWDGTNWNPLGTGVSINGTDPGEVRAIAVYNGELIVAGYFTEAGGVPATSIARWDGNAWHALGATGLAKSSGFPDVRGLAVYKGELVVVGSFDSADGSPVGNIAKWNGAAWSTFSTVPDTDTILLSVAAQGNDLYVSGDFDSVGGQPAGFIAHWNGTSWETMGGGFDNIATSIVLSGTDLYAAGRFFFAGGVYVSGIATWDGTAWSALGDGLQIRINAGGDTAGVPQPEQLAVVNGELVVTGTFDRAGPQEVHNFARYCLGLPSPCPADFNGVNGVTVQDIFDFLTAWLAGNASADFNHFNGVTVQDIFDFLTAWLAGC